MCFSRGWSTSTNLFRLMFVWIIKTLLKNWHYYDYYDYYDYDYDYDSYDYDYYDFYDYDYYEPQN